MLGVVVFLCAWQEAEAQGRSHYNILSIRSEQLSNAVRITINADGAISYSGVEYWEFYDWDKYRRSGWVFTPDVLRPVRVLNLHLHNARSQVGSFVQIGKYPVSHAELSVPPGTANSFALDIDIHFHAPCKLASDIPEDYVPNPFDEDVGNTRAFSVTKSRDHRSIIITVTSDRMPVGSARLSPESVRADERELSVSFEKGLLNLHARNAALDDVMRAVSDATGKEIVVDSSAERLVTAELFSITPDDLLKRITACYGLVQNGTNDRPVLADISVESTSAYTAAVTSVLPVRWLKVETARDLLPSFLLDYIRVDPERNTLSVTGSRELFEKIRSDLAVIDQPARIIEVRARLLESSSSEDILHDLAASDVGKTRTLSVKARDGSLFFAKSDEGQERLEAQVQALLISGKVSVVSDAVVQITSGSTGEVFSGVDKYVHFKLSGYYVDTIEPVNVGVRVVATPWTGGGHIMMSLKVEAKSIDGVDHSSGLPVLSAKTSEGVFQVTPGESIIIGGLSQTQDYSSDRRLPVLGRIPILGKLFTKRVKQQMTSEQTLILTATICKENRRSDEQS